MIHNMTEYNNRGFLSKK